MWPWQTIQKKRNFLHRHRFTFELCVYRIGSSEKEFPLPIGNFIVQDSYQLTLIDMNHARTHSVLQFRKSPELLTPIDVHILHNYADRNVSSLPIRSRSPLGSKQRFIFSDGF